MTFQLDDSVLSSRMTAHEWVRERLRRAIFTGELPPSSRLVQTELADRLGVSVTPVREAMRDLVNEGLIHLDPHKAARVRDFDIDEAIEIYEIRRLLEPEGVRKATVLLTEDQIDELEHLQSVMEDDVDPATWMELNYRWHVLVTDAAASPRLSEMLRNLRQVSRFYHAASFRVGTDSRAKGHRDHHVMIAAFRGRDAETAARVAEQHLPTTDELRRRFESSGEPSAQ